MDFDFNSTSKSKRTSEAIEHAVSFADAVNVCIDDWIAKDTEQSARDRPFNVSPSLIGDECAREIQFNVTGVSVTLSPRTHRIFDRGNVYEDIVAAWVRGAGFHLKTLDDDGKQFGFSLAKGNIRGRTDGVILDGPKIPNAAYPALWECKVLGDKGWKNLVAKDLAEAYPKYAGQVAMYQAYKSLENPAILTALNINTMELHHELVPFDAALAQRMSDRSVDVLLACQSDVLLPRAGGQPDHFVCRFCDFNDHCWSDGKLGPKRPAR